MKILECSIFIALPCIYWRF